MVNHRRIWGGGTPSIGKGARALRVKKKKCCGVHLHGTAIDFPIAEESSGRITLQALSARARLSDRPYVYAQASGLSALLLLGKLPRLMPVIFLGLRGREREKVHRVPCVFYVFFGN